MKKILFSLGVMLSAFALTNCTQEIENPAQQPESAGYPFEIVASTVDTKTVNDGMHTKWAEGDQINLFHAVTDGTDYKNNGAFTVKDVEAGSFTGNLSETLDVEEEYDWYALYPYSDKITTPGERTAGFVYIGYSSGLNQTEYNSTASLKGSVCPLYGVAKAVPGADMPSIEMKHLSSVVAIKITNKTNESLTVTEASMTAEEDIVGTYFIDITGESVNYTPSAANYVKNTAVVKITGEEDALSTDESATLYAAIKPFTAKAGQKLTLSVNGYSKELTLPKDVTFSAGKIKTLNFAYDKVEEPAPEGTTEATIVFSECGYANAANVNNQSIAIDENVTATFKQGKAGTAPAYYDSGKAIRMYQGGATLDIISSNNNIITKIELTFANSQYYIAADSGELSAEANVRTWTGNASAVKFTSTGTDKDHRAYVSKISVTYVSNAETPEPEPEPEPDQPESVELTVAEFLEKDVDDNVYYTLKGTITSVANTSYGNFDLTDDTGTVYIYGLCSPDGATTKYWATSGAKLGDDIVISVPRAEFNGQAQGKNARFIKLSSPGTRAFYTLSTEAVDFSSTGGEHIVKVSAYNTDAVVTASSDNAKFTVAVDDYNVTISSAANDLEEAVTGNVTINVGNLESTIVKVTLAAKPASGVVEGGSDDFHTISATNTSYVSGKTTAGWNYKNCAIFKGGTSDSSPAFKMIGDASNRALCMNGKTSAKGTITSPTLTTGCGTLKFNYGLPFSDTKIKFSVDIMQNGTVVKTFTIDKASASKLTKYSHEEAINVAGDFQIVFTNLSPSNSTSNKDRTAIWDVEWTGCN